MTRRTFLQRTVQLMLGLGITQYLPASWQQALAAAHPRPALPPADGFQALVFCDSQCGGSYSTWHDTLASAWERFPQASFFTDIGDLADNGEDDWQWEQFLNVLRPFADAHPFRPVMGNHECYGQDWKNCLPKKYLASFDFPENGTVQFHGYFYAFEQPPVQFVALNTQMLELDEFFGQGKLLNAQLLWLKRLLRQKKQPWTVVLMHKDILAYDEYQPGSGSSGSFSDTGRAFLPTLQKLGVDLILTGHMHTYRRRGPLEGWSTGKKGPLCLMSGPAGNQCYTVPSDPLDLAAAPQPTEPNYLILTARPKELTVTCLTVSGLEIDSITLKKAGQT